MTKEFHIKAAGPCWETEDKNSEKTILRSPTKRDLIFRTMEVAKNEVRCRIIIHNPDGTVEEEKIMENNQENKLKEFLKYYYSNL